MTEDPEDTAIRARRARSNEAIAAHDAAALRRFFDPKITLITGAGLVLLGVDAAMTAFEGQFKDPDFVTYLRSTETVTLDHERKRAAEHGHWVGTWKSAEGGTRLSGTYLATWKKPGGAWILESELYIRLK